MWAAEVKAKQDFFIADIESQFFKFFKKGDILNISKGHKDDYYLWCHGIWTLDKENIGDIVKIFSNG